MSSFISPQPFGYILHLFTATNCDRLWLYGERSGQVWILIQVTWDYISAVTDGLANKKLVTTLSKYV